MCRSTFTASYSMLVIVQDVRAWHTTALRKCQISKKARGQKKSKLTFKLLFFYLDKLSMAYNLCLFPQEEVMVGREIKWHQDITQVLGWVLFASP